MSLREICKPSHTRDETDEEMPRNGCNDLREGKL